MKFQRLVIVASAALVALGGFAIGRMTAPGAAGSANRVSENSIVTKGVGSSPDGFTQASSKTPTSASVAGLKPISVAELKSELTALEGSGGYFGSSYNRKVADLQDRLKVSDLASMAAGMSVVPMAAWRDYGFSLVMSAYAECDPQGAWNLALGIKDRRRREDALMNVGNTTGAKDPARALAMADTLEDPHIKYLMRSRAILDLSGKDPQRALALAMEGGKFEEGDSSVSQIFTMWAQNDPEAAKAALSRLSGRNAEQARLAFVSSLTQTDPQAAWNYALTLPSPGEGGYHDVRVRVVQQWAQSDPQAALQAALSISDATAKDTAIGVAVSFWAQSDFSGTLKYAISVDDPTVRSNILRTLSNDSKGNRRELLRAVLDHMPPGDSFQEAVSMIVSGWAGENPTEAAAAISQLPPGRVFSQAADRIASQWARSATNKQEVVNWVQTLPEGEARKNGMGSVFSEWSNSDPQGALKALGSLPPEDRKRALSSLASGWSRKSPEAVLQWAGTMADAGERASIVQTAVSQWANTQPDAAARYVEQLPEAQRSRPMQAVVNNWASKNTEAAAAWLERQPAGTSKDAALGSLARKISQEDPEAALTWVAGISDEKQRLSQTENVARDWIRQAPTAAHQWVSSSNLPEDVRKRLLK
jgi:hypothetical protein